MITTASAIPSLRLVDLAQNAIPPRKRVVHGAHELGKVALPTVVDRRSIALAHLLRRANAWKNNAPGWRKRARKYKNFIRKGNMMKRKKSCET